MLTLHTQSTQYTLDILSLSPASSSLSASKHGPIHVDMLQYHLVAKFQEHAGISDLVALQAKVGTAGTWTHISVVRKKAIM